MMANSIASLSRRLHRALLSNHKFSHFSMPFCTTTTDHSDSEIDPDEFLVGLEADSAPNTSSTTTTDTTGSSNERRTMYDRPLENGLDVGIYKAILVGQVGQPPLKKRLRSGNSITLFSLGTGGIRNSRRPLDNEEPKEYENRCSVQWHRVAVYPDRLGSIVVKHVAPGSIVYVEGNLETKIFTDPTTGLVRRIREVAVRRNGRIVFLGKGTDEPASSSELRGAGYY